MTAARQVANGTWASATGSSTSKAGLTSAGTTQATATLVQLEYNEFTTVAASSGAVLPTSQQIGGLQAGDGIEVANMGANALLVYPPVGGKVNLLAVNTGFSVPSGKVAKFIVSVTGTLNFTAILSA